LTIGSKKKPKKRGFKMPNNFESPSPNCKLDFGKNPKSVSVFFLRKSIGKKPDDLLSTFKIGEFENQEYLLLEKPLYKNEERFDFLILTTNEKCIEARQISRPHRAPVKKAIVCGFKLNLEYPGKAYSDYNGKSVLIEFLPEEDKLTLWLFDVPGQYSRSLFAKWVAGNLNLIVERRGIDPALLGGNQ